MLPLPLWEGASEVRSNHAVGEGCDETPRSRALYPAQNWGRRLPATPHPRHVFADEPCGGTMLLNVHPKRTSNHATVRD